MAKRTSGVVAGVAAGVAVWAALAGVAAAGGAFVFEDASARMGLRGPLTGIMAHAAACGDLDGDGDLDLFVGTFCDRSPEKYKPAPGPVPNVLLVNEGGVFRDAGQPALAVKARTSGAAFVDLDNDGDLDLYVANNSKSRGLRVANRLYENVGGRLRDISEGNGACIVMGSRSVGVLDYDGDGLLDLLVAGDRWTDSHTRLFRNAGKLAFEDVTAKVGLPAVLPGCAILTPDLNADGCPDIFVSQANRLFVSKGDGTYRESAASKSFQYPPLGREDSPCGAAFGDVDGDGDMDLVIVDHNQPARQHLFENLGTKGGDVAFREITAEAGLKYLFPSWTPDHLHLKHANVDIADFDNDGRPDIGVAAMYRAGDSEQPFICRNVTKPGGRPRFQVPPVEKATGYSAAGPVADFDRDGRLDMVQASWWPHLPTTLLMNRTKGGHWLRVRVTGKGKKINRMGIGAKVTLYRAGQAGKAGALLGVREICISQGFCTGSEAVAHFGLGAAAACDVVAELPHGKGIVRKTNVRADREVVLTGP